MKKLLNFILFLCFISYGQNIEGSWSGELDINGVKLPIILKIKAEGNTFKSTMDSPKQGAKDIPINETLFSNNVLTINAVNLGVTYTGTYKQNKFEGVFKQGNMELPLTLEKSNGDKQYASFNRPQTPKDPFNYNIENVTFVNPKDKNTLAGTIVTPKNKKNFPILVMITGSGAQDRDETLFDHKPFLVIADDFAKKGIATLRLDDRGVGGSSKSENKPTTADFATDISTAVDFLATKGYKNIGLIGHSEGGMIAPMVTTMNNKVKFFISMAGPGIKISELMAMQIEQDALLSGAEPEKAKLDVKIAQSTFNFVNNYKGDNLAKDLESYYLSELKKFPKKYTEGENLEEKSKSEIKSYLSPWFRYFMAFDPQNYITKVKIPVLAINGSKDFQVDAKANLEGFKKGLTKAGNKKFEIVNFEGLNHLFQECKTGAFSEYSEIEQTISPKVLEKMSSWILKL